MQQPSEPIAQTDQPINFDVTLLNGMIEKAVAFIPSVIGALVVLVLGLWIAGRIRKFAVKAMSRSGRIDETLCGFLSSLI